MNANRDKGHRAERAVAAWLREHGYPDAETTRARLGHDGTKQPGDVDGIPGVSLEVKDKVSYDIGAWLRQTEAQAGHNLPVLVVKPHRVADPGEWWAVLPLRVLVELLQDDDMIRTLADYNAVFHRAEPIAPDVDDLR